MSSTGINKQRAEKSKGEGQKPELRRILPIAVGNGAIWIEKTFVSLKIKGTHTMECPIRAERASDDKAERFRWEGGRTAGVVMGWKIRRFQRTQGSLRNETLGGWWYQHLVQFHVEINMNSVPGILDRPSSSLGDPGPILRDPGHQDAPEASG